MGWRSLFNKKRKKKSVSSETDSPAPPSRSVSLRSRCLIAADLEQVFKRFDANGDGKISSAELGSIMASLGQPATEEELNTMIREVDADGDGYIDLNEFIGLNTNGIDAEEVLENLKDAFSVFDMDGNGSITADELCKVLKSLGDEVSLAECRKMISGVDGDGDGMIDFEEFKVMMTMDSRSVSSNRATNAITGSNG